VPLLADSFSDRDVQQSGPHGSVYLGLLNAITYKRPTAVEDELGAYYAVIGQCCRSLTESAQLPELARAVTGPLKSTSTGMSLLATINKSAKVSWSSI